MTSSARPRQISSALPSSRPTHGDARIAAVNGVEMLGAHYTYFKSNYGSDLIALTGRLGDLAQDSPGPEPIPDDTGGIKKPIDNHRPHTDRRTTKGSSPPPSGDAGKPLSGDNGASRGAISSQGRSTGGRVASDVR